MEPDAYVDALKREREHYARTGRKDRAAAVDAELAKLGAKAKTPEPEAAPVETAAAEAPETAARPRAARKAAR